MTGLCFEPLRYVFFFDPLVSKDSNRLEFEPLTLWTKHTPGETPDDWLSDTAFVFVQMKFLLNTVSL